MSTPPINVEQAVGERYSKAAASTAPDLCCAVDYDSRYLKILPQEIVDRDYGCGDPSRYVKAGETVLDLGSGGGKICYIAAQVVGPEGRVIGVDMNDEMLELAERHRQALGDQLGYHNVSFHKAKIQDLALDQRRLESYLEEHPVHTPADLQRLERWTSEERSERPVIPDGSVDVIVSNCVLNLVRPEDRRQLFREMHRVLADGGRAVISDIVSDEVVPAEMRNDPTLWSGCVSGAFVEDEFLAAFEEAGVYGIRIRSRDDKPWRTVEGIEFRSLTVEAFKGKEGPCLERNQTVIYRGPWRSVTDDDGHTLHRGQRMALCDKTFRIYSREPYASELERIAPYREVPLTAAKPFACSGDATRNARATKGDGYRVTDAEGGSCCEPDCC